MSDESEVIRRQMAHTRSGLGEKLESLEQEVVHKVADAGAAISNAATSIGETVGETVETIKESVQQTTDRVKDIFDLAAQMQRHPWLFVGGSIAVGYIGGRMLQRPSQSAFAPTWREEASGSMRQAANMVAGNGSGHAEIGDGSAIAAAVAPPQTDRLKSAIHDLGQEMTEVKALAIGAGLGAVREIIVHRTPGELQRFMGEVINTFIKKLGGEVIACGGTEQASTVGTSPGNISSRKGDDRG